MNVLHKSNIADALSRYTRVLLYTDVVPDPTLTREAAEAAARKNRDLEYKLVKTIAVPAYVIIDPTVKQTVADHRDEVKVISKTSGIIENLAEFQQFLINPLLAKPPIEANGTSKTL